MIRRRMAMFLPLWLLLTLCPFGYGQQPAAAEPPAKEQAKDEEGWGEPVNGLRLRLSADKTTIPLRGTFCLVLELEHVGQVAFSLKQPMIQDEIAISGQRERFTYQGYNSLIVARLVEASLPKDILGDGLKSIEAGVPNKSMENIIPLEWTLRPGQRLEIKMIAVPELRDRPLRGRRKWPPGELCHKLGDPSHIAFLATNPGTYQLQAIYALDNSSPKTKDWEGWTGQIKSKPFLLEVTKEEAKPDDDKAQLPKQ